MKLTKLDWKPADSAYGRGQQAYIEFGQALAKLVTEGATQEQIADRYDLDQAAVSRAMAVGADKRIMPIGIGQLPKSRRYLYRLTKLDDKGFAEMAKPDKKLRDMDAYERRLAPPPPAAPAKPIVPPKVEKTTDKDVEEILRSERQRAEPKESYSKDLSWAFATFGIQGTPMISMESLDAIYRVLSTKRHPDKPGGSTTAMSDLNTARTTIIERNIWVR